MITITAPLAFAPSDVDRCVRCGVQLTPAEQEPLCGPCHRAVWSVQVAFP
jgi:hypothetical protein